MITIAQAKRLRTLITQRCTAKREEEMAGSQPPLDTEMIRLALENAQLKLDTFINEITEPKK